MKGFTLLEVMIALAIMAGVILTVISSFNYHLSVVDRNREETVATVLARTKLEDPTFKMNVAGKGTFAPDWPDISWETTVTPMEEIPGVSRETLTVSWNTEQRKLSFVKYAAQQTQ